MIAWLRRLVGGRRDGTRSEVEKREQYIRDELRRLKRLRAIRLREYRRGS